MATQPDADAIKLFIGQVPTDIEQSDLRNIFEEYGRIHQFSIIKDRATGLSKGCCFLTYFTRQSALDAQKALHGIMTLPGSKFPIQVKPATVPEVPEEERRLFVGMLSRSTTESELAAMFAPYGAVQSTVILKERDGESRGCAFVIFATRPSAQNAVRGLNRSKVMEGCKNPLVVKFADTQKVKEMRKLQQNPAASFNQTSSFDAGSPQSQFQMLLQQASSGGGMNILSNLGTLGVGLTPAQIQQIVNAAMTSLGLNPKPMNFGMSSFQGNNFSSPPPFNNFTPTRPTPPTPFSMPPPSLNLPPTGSSLPGANIPNALGAVSALASNPVLGAILGPSLALLQQLTAANNNLSGVGVSGQFGNGSVQSGMSFGANQAGGNMLGQAYSGLNQFKASGFNSNSFGNQSSKFGSGSFGGSAGGQSKFAGLGKNTRVPDSCNLFIYHLPEAYGDSDLYQVFQPFGNVISAKVFRDKITNVSKCFGFVSYNNEQSAQLAIKSMNGFMIGSRRIKVQIKTPRSEANKPY